MSTPQNRSAHIAGHRDHTLVFQLWSAVISPDLLLFNRPNGQVALYRTETDNDAYLGTFSSICDIWQVVDEIDSAWAATA